MASHDHSVVWTLASELVARQGPIAAQRALERSRELEHSGDKSGAAVWARVAEAAATMLHPTAARS